MPTYQNVDVVNVLGSNVLLLLLKVKYKCFDKDQFVLDRLEKMSFALITQSLCNLSTVRQQSLASLDQIIDQLMLRVRGLWSSSLSYMCKNNQISTFLLP